MIDIQSDRVLKKKSFKLAIVPSESSKHRLLLSRQKKKVFFFFKLYIYIYFYKVFLFGSVLYLFITRKH